MIDFCENLPQDNEDMLAQSRFAESCFTKRTKIVASFCKMLRRSCNLEFKKPICSELRDPNLNFNSCFLKIYPKTADIYEPN